MVSRAETTTPSDGQLPKLEEWLGVVGKDRSDSEIECIRSAMERAEKAHSKQTRASGEPYFIHSLAVAEIVHHLHLDHEAVAAALLHDVVEDTEVSLQDIESEFNPPIANLVDGVTKMGLIGEVHEESISAHAATPTHAENVRKLLLAMAKDVRVVLIKLADRLHNMRTLRYLSEERQRRISQETLDIFAPLANRLGIWQVKWELEDLSLRYLDPNEYRRIASLLDGRRVDREKQIEEVKEILTDAFKQAGIEAQISGRPKHIYSIWKKMQRKNIDFQQIFDVQALRVLVDKTEQCYAVLGIVHGLWRHIPHEFDDYIASPKVNNYRSLHTAVIGPNGKPIEVQIRTHAMHDHAELGIASHWRYKEGGKFDEGYEKKIAWLRQLLEWKDEESSADAFVDRFKSEAVEERIYVLTPNGEVIDLAAGATALDFAFHIHTDVGVRCRGVKVNGRIVPLTYKLKSGEQVEVLTAKNGVPSRDWLNPNLGYLTTSRARAKARHWFKQQDREINISAGEAALEKELKRLGLAREKLDIVAKKLNFKEVDSMMSSIGGGDLPIGQVVTIIMHLTENKKQLPVSIPVPTRRVTAQTREGFKVLGVGNLLTHAARCCHPVPDDPIVGFITRGRGVTIHRQDCANVLRLKDDDRDRLIDVEWGSAPDKVFPVDVQLSGYDRPGLLRDVTGILADERVNVMGVNTRTDPKAMIANMTLHIEVVNIGQLSNILSRMAQLPNVIEVKRKV